MFGYPDKKQDIRLGSLDFETYGIGSQTVYAAGCALNELGCEGYKKIYYVIILPPLGALK